jgi:3-hydroxybutyryl-CoA dehydratase
MTDFPDIPTPRSLTATPERALAYAALTCDFNPLHIDPVFAATTAFGGPIAHGTMALNLLLNGIESACGDAFRIASLDIRFTAPTPIGATIRTGGQAQGGGVYAVWVYLDTGARVIDGTLTLARA